LEAPPASSYNACIPNPVLKEVPPVVTLPPPTELLPMIVLEFTSVTYISTVLDDPLNWTVAPDPAELGVTGIGRPAIIFNAPLSGTAVPESVG